MALVIAVLHVMSVVDCLSGDDSAANRAGELSPKNFAVSAESRDNRALNIHILGGYTRLK